MTTSTRPATSSDVARRAGVSRTTVSHVLNGQGERFPEETRQRVRMAAAELDYVPSPAGRALANGRSDTVVLLLPSAIFAGNLQDVADRLAVDLAAIGANLVVRFAGPTPSTTAAALVRMRPLAVVDMGVGLSAEDRAPLTTSGTLLIPQDIESADADLTALDDQIMELQVGALVTGGPSRRLYYAGLVDHRSDPFVSGRAASLLRVCDKLGIVASGTISVPLELSDAVAALKPVVSGGPIGIACYNDHVALAVLAAARELGLRTPTDVAVVGVDAIELGRLWSPPLTSVRIDIQSIADRLAAALLTAIGNRGTSTVALPLRTGSRLASLLPGGSA
ncbi:LacI family DNA-binding transcriptional regulator [Microbacterium saperdae]